MVKSKISEAIYFLENKRGFTIENIKKYDYIVYDEDFTEKMTAEELLFYAEDQKMED